jgi:hypothetical protein
LVVFSVDVVRRLLHNLSIPTTILRHSRWEFWWED